MFINENDIKYIRFSVVNKKNYNILKEKFFYFDDRADREDDAIFLSCVLESLIKFKGYSKNINIMIYNKSIDITCYYHKLYSRNGEYTRTIMNYLNLMRDIEIQHGEYLEVIEYNL